MSQNKVNVYSAIQATKRKHITNTQEEAPEFTPIKKQTPNGYVFYSYRRPPEQIIDSNSASQKSLNIAFEDSQIIEESSKPENSLEALSKQSKATPKEEESLEKQEELEKDHKYFFIGLLLFLNLALFALIAYNQIRFFKESQDLANSFNSSVEVFEKELQSSTNSIIDELRNLINSSQTENNKQSLFINKSKLLKIRFKSSKKQIDKLPKFETHEDTKSEKDANINEETPATNFSIIKLPTKAASKGYPINLTGQAELYSSYETIAKDNNDDFFSDQKKFYKSRKE